MIDKAFYFYKNNNGEWFFKFPEWEGDPSDLQMIEGADEWLDLVANQNARACVRMANSPFPAAEVLTLLHLKEPNLGGGGVYGLTSFNGKQMELQLWLCQVTEFVFGEIPRKIYFKTFS